MPETAYNETYDQNGNVIESVAVIISDDQLLWREAQGNVNSSHQVFLQLIRDWPTLTPAQKLARVNELFPLVVEACLVYGEQLGNYRV